MKGALGLVSAAALMVAGATAHADVLTGPYVTGFGGYVIVPDLDIKGGPDAELKNGWAAGGAVGYDFGRARVEMEGAYRRNKKDNTVNKGDALEAYTGMLNLLYDFENESAFTPFVGFGVGAAYLDEQHDTDSAFAYQAIAGFKLGLTDALSAVVDYRYLRTLNADIYNGEGPYKSHTITAGLSYNMGELPAPPPPPPPPAPMPEPPPAPELARSYVVFFDWDSVEITSEAHQIIADAANAAQTMGVTRIELTGHADRSGSAKYNQRLSERRADAVKAVLISLGVGSDQIATVGKGENEPLVPTPDGVREPQNRRVEIVLP